MQAFMRFFLLSICCCLLFFPVRAQTGKKPAVHRVPAKSVNTQSKDPASKSIDDKNEFDKASALEDPNEKIAALTKFIARFPDSTLLNQARELLSATAYGLADASYANGSSPAAIDLFKQAVSSAPTPIPAALFNDSLSKVPNTLYWH